MRDAVTGLVRSLGRRYVGRRLAAELDGVNVMGVERLRAARERAPVLLAANHVSWWDSMLLVHLDAQLDSDARVLMDQAQLERYPFFAAFGALGIDRSHPMRMRHGLRAMAGHLDRPGRVGWIFPQGQQQPAHRRPLGLQPGVSWLARSTGATVLPVSIDYPFLETARPAAFVYIGPPVETGSTEGLETALVSGLQAIDEAVKARSGAFSSLVPAPREGEGASRALAWLWNGLVGRPA